MTAAVIGLLLPVGAAWLSLLALRLRSARDSTLLTLAVAACCGLGLSSVVTFWCAELGVAIGAWFAAVDALVWTAIGAVAWRALPRRGTPSPSHPTLASQPEGQSLQKATTADWLVRAAFGAIAVIGLATAIAHNVASPHGEWDAWAIWNLKARFLVRDIDHWTAMLKVPWSNPSHPLLLSLSVARLWAYAGSETTFVPAMLGIVWGIGSVMAVMGALDTRRRRAWVAGSVLIAPATFPQLASAQTADLAVALFVVATLIMLRSVVGAPRLDTRDARGRLLLAGFLGSVAAWTKNEGLLLVVITAVIVVWVTLSRGQARTLVSWVAGAVPVGVTVLWFKLAVAPSVPLPYIPETQGAPSLVARLFDFQRHAAIGSLTGSHWLSWGGPLTAGVLPLTLAAAVLAALLHSGRPARVAMMVVILMLVGYEVVWVLSPIDASWLVGTTFDRLVMQIWPTLVLVAFAAGDSSRDDAAEPPSSPHDLFAVPELPKG